MAQRVGGEAGEQCLPRYPGGRRELRIRIRMGRAFHPQNPGQFLQHAASGGTTVSKEGWSLPAGGVLCIQSGGDSRGEEGAGRRSRGWGLMYLGSVLVTCSEAEGGQLENQARLCPDTSEKCMPPALRALSWIQSSPHDPQRRPWATILCEGLAGVESPRCIPARSRDLNPRLCGLSLCPRSLSSLP